MNREADLRFTGGLLAFPSRFIQLLVYHRLFNSYLVSRTREVRLRSTMTAVDLAIGGATGEPAEQE